MHGAHWRSRQYGENAINSPPVGRDSGFHRLAAGCSSPDRCSTAKSNQDIAEPVGFSEQAISGTANIFRKLRQGRKQTIGMVIGKPYNLPNLPNTARRDALRIHTDYIMQKISELLPDRHRGMYKKQ